MKKFTIITVNLNNKDGLQRTIDSVRKQTFKDYEYIIIDGSSKDGSINVIKENEDIITYWVSEKDTGIYNAMNKGIDMADSEYTIFMNSGDYFTEDNVLEQVETNLEDNDIVYGDLLVHGKNKKFILKYPFDIDVDYFYNNTLPHQGSFIKTKLLKEKKYSEDYKIVSDWIFFYESIINEKCSHKHIPIVIADFFLGGVSTEFDKLNKEKRKYLDIVQEKKLDIFICTHKRFKKIVKSPIYKVIDTRKIDKSDFVLKDDFYSEFLSYFYIAKNYELKDYVGFCHYRRYFAFKDDIPSMDSIFSKYKIMVAKPRMMLTNLKEQYNISHNIEDLYIVSGIIGEMHPDCVGLWNSFLDHNIIFPYNMFIMKKEDFLEYVEFVKGILDRYLDIVGTDINKRIKNNKDKYIKDFFPNNSAKYQYRIGGYIGERLTNLFIMKKYKLNEIMYYTVDVTENKYNVKDNM